MTIEELDKMAQEVKAIAHAEIERNRELDRKQSPNLEYLRLIGMVD